MLITALIGCATYKSPSNTIKIDKVYVIGTTNAVPVFSQELLFEQETGEVGIRAQGAENVR